MIYIALLGHSGGALIFGRNFLSLLLRWSNDADPPWVPPDHTYVRAEAGTCTHLRASRRGHYAAAQVHTHTHTHAQMHTREVASSTTVLPTNLKHL